MLSLPSTPMAIFNVVMRLHDIDDVEQLCTRAARRWLNRNSIVLSSGGELTESDFESLVSFLVIAVWKAAERYEPAKSSSFEAVIRGRLTNRCVDWLRTHRGRTRWQFGDRTYEREIPTAISLDAISEDGRDPLALSLATVDSDPQTGFDSDSFGGLLDDRDSEAPRDTALVRALAHRLLRDRDQTARAA